MTVDGLFLGIKGLPVGGDFFLDPGAERGQMIENELHILLDKKGLGGFVAGLQAEFQALDLLLEPMDIGGQNRQGFIFVGQLDNVRGQPEMLDEVGLDGGIAMVTGTFDIGGGKKGIDLIKDNGFQARRAENPAAGYSSRRLFENAIPRPGEWRCIASLMTA